MTRRPLPATTTLAADDGLRLRANGRVLFGGNPLRVLRLTEQGAVAVSRWFGGEAPDDSPGATALARRLVDAGMAHPQPTQEPVAEAASLTVVIPVKDDEQGLLATLAGLTDHGIDLVVVDDGSADDVSALVADVAPDCTVVRRNTAGGPAQARQDGLARVGSELVAFVDAGVEVRGDDLQRLLRWFADPEIVAAAPRVASAPGIGDVAEYELASSPLDLGPTPSPVGPGRTVTYVPTACLVARRADVVEVGGFDPTLRFGEDVDLVWRLGRRGAVRYDPSVVVHHRPRATLSQLATQRFGYGTSAGPLARRHGAELAPVQVSTWSAAVIVLALLGRFKVSAAVAVFTAVALARKLDGVLPDHRVEAALLTARGHTWAARSVADAATGAWWPLATAAALAGWHRPLRWALLWRLWQRLSGGHGPIGRRLRHLGYGFVDDAAYGSGVWVGAWRSRAPRALLPRVVNWPDP
ncbi:MAG: mycofactocin biosynthesis glycosyltransferase MftF [Actinomycetota bacterium]